jgi:hypothetical protein
VHPDHHGRDSDKAEYHACNPVAGHLLVACEDMRDHDGEKRRRGIEDRC